MAEILFMFTVVRTFVAYFSPIKNIQRHKKMKKKIKLLFTNFSNLGRKILIIK